MDITDAFLLAGAQTVVAPLWSDESNALATVLFTIKFYDDLVDCADEIRPVAVAVKHASNWLKDATFAIIRNFIWASRVDRLLLEEIDDELWSIALAQKMLKGHGANFHSTDDRWSRIQKDARPFASPFFWAAFRAVGSCGGVHDPRVAERDEFDEFKEDKTMERMLEEFDQNEGYIEASVVKGLRAVGSVAGDVGEKIGKVTEKPLAQVKDRVQAEKDKVMETVISKRMALEESKTKLSSAAKERSQRAREAIRNAPKLAKASFEKEKQERKKRQR